MCVLLISQASAYDILADEFDDPTKVAPLLQEASQVRETLQELYSDSLEQFPRDPAVWKHIADFMDVRISHVLPLYECGESVLKLCLVLCVLLCVFADVV